MPATVRTAKKLLLGREIAHMIELAGLSQADAAKVLETSPARVRVLINGGGSISAAELVLLADKLGFTEEGYQESLRELRRDNHKRGFWSTGHNRAYSEDLRLLVDLEKHADQIRVAQVEVVPGLLQCQSYVRAQHADQSDINDVSLEDRISSRLARQDILDKPEPPTVQFVLSESCLRRTCGGAEVMREQIDYLITLSQRPNVVLQLLPFDQPAGQRSPFKSPFTLVHVPSPGVAGPLELVYVEGEGEIRYLDDAKAVAAHEAAWARVSNAALRSEETRKFLRSLLQDFRK